MKSSLKLLYKKLEEGYTFPRYVSGMVPTVFFDECKKEAYSKMVKGLGINAFLIGIIQGILLRNLYIK